MKNRRISRQLDPFRDMVIVFFIILVKVDLYSKVKAIKYYSKLFIIDYIILYDVKGFIHFFQATEKNTRITMQITW